MVLVHRDGTAYEVEFVTQGGETLAVVTLPAEAFRFTIPKGAQVIRSPELKEDEG